METFLRDAPKSPHGIINPEQNSINTYQGYVQLNSLSEEGDVLHIEPKTMLKFRQLFLFLELNKNMEKNFSTSRKKFPQISPQFSFPDSLPIPFCDEKEKKIIFKDSVENSVSTYLTNFEHFLREKWPEFGQGWFVVGKDRSFKRGDLSFALSTQTYFINNDNNIEYKEYIASQESQDARLERRQQEI